MLSSGRRSRALSIAVDLDDIDLRIGATYALGANMQFAGDYRECATFLRRNLEAVDGDRRFETFGRMGLASVVTRGPLIVSFTELGELGDAIAVATEAVQVAEEADQPYSMTYAHEHAGFPQLMQGDLTGAIRHLERSVHLAETQDNGGFRAIAGTKLGYAYVLSGRAQDGLPRLRGGADQFESRGHLAHLAQAQMYLAHALLLCGEAEPAHARSQQLPGAEAELARCDDA